MPNLSVILRLNALSCIGFGLLFMVLPDTVASFLGEAPPIVLRVVGALLGLHGLHLTWASLRRVPQWELYYFVVGDLLWVSLTALLLGAGIWITTSAGIGAAIVVAAFVGALGILQAAESPVEEDTSGSDGFSASHSRLSAIGHSWMHLKTWVKVWLFVINFAFIAALIFWPHTIAKLSIAAYIAAGPWLLAMMLAQRGLTRLLGLAHLIPWTPLLAYLVYWLVAQGSANSYASEDGAALYFYALSLTAIVAVCLAFDIYDVARWLKGQRYRFGAPDAR